MGVAVAVSALLVGMLNRKGRRKESVLTCVEEELWVRGIGSKLCGRLNAGCSDVEDGLNCRRGPGLIVDGPGLNDRVGPGISLKCSERYEAPLREAAATVSRASRSKSIFRAVSLN